MSNIRFAMLQVFLICVSFTTSAQSIDHWETVVYNNSMWRYFPGASDPGATWMKNNFVDGTWSQGQGGFGFGDGDDHTTTSPAAISVFSRITFTITNLSKIESALLHVDYDDGYVAYLNGTEIARANMGNANPVPYDQPSGSPDHEAVLYTNGVPEGVLLNKQKIEDLVVQGSNVLAIEVHNISLTSTDLTSSAFFSVGISDNSTTYGTVPDWFEEPLNFESSTLPIIVINTNDQEILDDPRITADIGIIDNGTNLNHVTDPFNNYAGKIGIEIRGESSQMFPKKSYSVETRDELGANKDVSLLGLPKENDWILYAPYTDKTLMRDVVTYLWGNQLGFYASRSRYVELVINGDYRGVYVLLEKIKRNKNRVDIANLKPEDISGDDLTGGYLLRVDKIDENDYPAWTSVPVPKLPGENNINFQFHDPEGEELVNVQQQYIKNFIFQFESALSGSSFKDPSTGYRKFIDVPSFIDFMIVNEIGKNVDAFVFSTYLHKDKDSNDGKLHMGPLWDFNLAYGNVDYNAGAQYAPGWMGDESYRMYWFRRLRQDPYFTNALKCRWTSLRATTFSNVKMLHTIDSIAAVLEEPQKRNYKRWPILGTYIWPNQFVGDTYQSEIDFMKQWIVDRLEWMDSNMPGSGPCLDPDPVTGIDPSQEMQLVVYPNPSSSSFHIEFPFRKNDRYTLSVFNSLSQKVYSIDSVEGDDVIWDAKDVPAGIYVVVIESPKNERFVARVIKQ